jgi:hypothetical protein
MFDEFEEEEMAPFDPLKRASRSLPAAFAALFLWAAASARAQTTAYDYGPGDEMSWTGYFGGGWVNPVGELNKYLDDGWNFSFGFGKKFNSNAALMLDFTSNWTDIEDSLLNSYGIPDGDVHLWGVTINPVWEIRPEQTLGGFVTAGGGYYHRTVTFTEPTIAVVPVIDPWWGFSGYYYDPFYGYTVAPASAVVGRTNDDALGANIGLGISLRPSQFIELFLEARYHYVWTEKRPTQIVPITIGMRW